VDIKLVVPKNVSWIVSLSESTTIDSPKSEIINESICSDNIKFWGLTSKFATLQT